MRDQEYIIEGRNPTLEALRSGRPIDKIFIQENSTGGPVSTIIKEAKKRGVRWQYVSKERIAAISPSGKSQGVVAYAAAYEYSELSDILKKAEDKGEDPFVIILDGIEDPHNLGAILRTANLAGAHGVVIQKDRACALTSTVVKASAGAINYTPTARVTNINAAIKELKERGLWIACADMDGEVMYRQDLTGPIGIVIGSEGKGVSRLVRENCDFAVSVPMKGDIDSLNASVAAGVLAYEVVRQRKYAG